MALENFSHYSVLVINHRPTQREAPIWPIQMWIGAKQAANSCAKTAQMRAFNRSFIHAPGMRICGSSVDDMCTHLYESNQPSKHYNKIFY